MTVYHCLNCGASSAEGHHLVHDPITGELVGCKTERLNDIRNGHSVPNAYKCSKCNKIASESDIKGGHTSPSYTGPECILQF